jgi:predicted acylesterase/phospholipase RssA
MPITIKGATKRICLALSGGGFRAAAFHLGVFRKLDPLGFVDKTDVVAYGSGGSIAGVVLGGTAPESWACPRACRNSQTSVRKLRKSLILSRHSYAGRNKEREHHYNDTTSLSTLAFLRCDLSFMISDAPSAIMAPARRRQGWSFRAR